MKTFIKFLLCTLFLCVQSSQTYVASAALWRFNDNAGPDVGTEVLVLGDYHVDEPIGKEHAKAILKKVDEWNGHKDATHFIMEEFPGNLSENQIKIIGRGSIARNVQLLNPWVNLRELRDYSFFQTIDQIRKHIRIQEQTCYSPKVIFNCADYRNYTYSFTRWLDYIENTDCYRQELFCKPSKSEFYHILPDLNLKHFTEVMHQKTCERILEMKEDIGLGARKTIESLYIDKVARLMNKVFAVLQMFFGEGIYVRDLEERFTDLYYKFATYDCLSGDLGFLLEFIKHKSEYKRHIFFVGNSHAVVINNLMEKYKKEKKVEEILKVGPCDINDMFLKWPYEPKEYYPATPIETQKLTNILNLAFTGVAKKDIGSLF